MRLGILTLVCLLASPCAIADSVSIHRMMMDGRILELAETRQVTSKADGVVTGAWLSPDGKHVAYVAVTKAHQVRACVMRSSGGRSTVLMASQGGAGENQATPREEWKPDIHSRSCIAWSPSSTLLAIPARREVHGTSDYRQERYVLVYTTAGARRAAFLVPEGYRPTGSLLWSPDGERIAGAFAGKAAELLIFTLSTGSVQTVFSQEEGSVDLEAWSADGKALQYAVSTDGKKTQLRESYLDGKPDSVIIEDYVRRNKSPDGKLQLAERPGISVENCLTGEVVDVFESRPGEFVGWAPNSKMFVYRTYEIIHDATGRRSRTLNMLWLAVPEAQPLNHMCAALDSEGRPSPTWSQDCMKMAYVCEGRACVAELSWQELSIQDKLGADLPLTDAEMKTVLLNNAKQIGTALAMYNSDWDGKWPGGDNFMQDVLAYCRNKNLFFLPGTEQVIFQYFAPGSATIESWAGTMVGLLDAGRGWVVALYADGHAKVIPKQ